MSRSVEDIARICHQTNKAYCEAIGDNSQVDWESAPDWQRSSAIQGVELVLKQGFTDGRRQHEAWMRTKLAEGWRYGPVKDAASKTHPCMMLYEDLPLEQRAKDYIFVAVVIGLQPPKSLQSCGQKVRDI